MRTNRPPNQNRMHSMSPPPHRKFPAPYDLPYTGTSPPRAARFWGDASDAITAATCSTFGQREKSALGIAARFAGVSMSDGTTAFTQIPSTQTSSESACVKVAPAALEAVYAVIPLPSRGSIAGRAATFTIRPPQGMQFESMPASRIRRTDSRQQR